MTGLTFVRPIGAAADVKELEYIIALQQTSPETRSNATVSSLDVQALIRSRYSLKVPHDEMANVLRALGGGDTLHDEPPPPPEKKDGSSDHHKKSRLGSGLTSWMHRSGSHDDDDDHHKSTTTTASKTHHKHRMHKLHFLHGNQHADEKSMHALKDEITADLAQKVAQTAKEKSLHDLSKDDDKDMEPTLTSTTTTMSEEDNDNKGDGQGPVDNGTDTNNDTGNNNAANNDKPATDNDPSSSKHVDENLVSADFRDEPTHPPNNNEQPVVLAEYLDLVQTLSTLLIPKLARVARDAQHELQTAAEGGDGEKEDAKEEDNDNIKNVDDDAGAGTRLKRRFVAYGRRKLQLHNANVHDYTATRVLELALESLVKTIPLDDGEWPVVDETLVQLLLLQHGEVERANNPALIQEMVQAATTASGVLDRAALAQAISTDLLECWDPSCQDEDTTFFHDVFGVSMPSIQTKLHAELENDKNETDIETSTPASPTRKQAEDEPQPDTPRTLTSVAEQNNNDMKQHEEERLSAFAKCMKFLFPVIHALKRGHYEFSTAFLGIDLVTDSANSLFLHILIWLSFILTSVTYGALLINAPGDIGEDCSGSEVWCTLSVTVWSWAMVAGLLIAMGMYHILPLSVGNNPADQSVRRKFFSMAVALINSLIPFFVVREVKNDIDNVSNEAIKDILESETYDIVMYCTTIVGVTIAGFYFLQGCLLFLFNYGIHMPRIISSLVSGAAFNAEVRVYRAAKFKINRLLSNALELHEPDEDDENNEPEENLAASITTGGAGGKKKEEADATTKLTFSHKMALKSTSDQTSRNFVLRGEKYEQVGGVVWSFWKVFDGSLFNEEGMWLNTRLLIIQVTQAFLAVLITAILLWVSVVAANAADEYREDMDPTLPDWVKDIFPTRSMVLGALIPATFVTMVMLIFLTIVYIPSSVATVFKYRGGILPSLGSPYFQKFRSAVDSVYMNTANAIYGMIGSSILFYLVVGAAIFLFLWPYTQDAMFLIVAWGIGLGITIGIKMLITTCYQKVQYRAYYRIKPAAARVTSLALECWHIGLAGSVLIARITQFLAAALFWVGRIDVPYLSEDVVLFGYGFDLVPAHYWKELLVHEAHRHPYIEQLTQMFLMKLRYGDQFISDAGTVWRQLVVLALFPWLAKKRVFRDERKASAEIEAEELEHMEAREDDAYAGAREMTHGVAHAGQEVGFEVFDAGHELVGAGEDIVLGVGKTLQKGARTIATGAVTTHHRDEP